jgi:ammonium transporter
MLISSALVLLMTIPGLALFYGGMVRAKNVLSIMMQCFAITALISILWVVYGYSLAFDTVGMEKGVVNFASFVGGFDKAFLSGLTSTGLTSAAALFPESIFVMFQMTFAIITPALIVGAFAERMKFSAMLIFTALWFTLVYAPIAHMVWSGDGGLMWDWGVLDFAGGTVVHINAGIAGLVACIVLGKRKGYPTAAIGSAQPGLHPDRRRPAVGRLVRLQRRFRRCRQRHRRHGHAGHPDRHRRRRPGLDVRRVDHPR